MSFTRHFFTGPGQFTCFTHDGVSFHFSIHVRTTAAIGRSESERANSMARKFSGLRPARFLYMAPSERYSVCCRT